MNSSNIAVANPWQSNGLDSQDGEAYSANLGGVSGFLAFK